MPVSGCAVTVRAFAAAFLWTLIACEAAPPAFSVEFHTPLSDHRDSASLVAGSVQTPPPGDYRFARVYSDGSVEARELFTVNGPGPWLAYEGKFSVPVSVARQAVDEAQVAVRNSAAGSADGPCVLSVTSATGQSWDGCVAPDLAARVLASVPRLTPPGVSKCGAQVCQLRLLKETPARRHERYGITHQDIVLDVSGAFWCALPAQQPLNQILTLTVDQGRVPATSAERVFQWMIRDAQLSANASEESPGTEIRVQVRGADAIWRTVPPRSADAVQSRWKRISPRFPTSCQLSSR